MAIINERWPNDLCPVTCTFVRSRNDVVQISPASRQSSVIRRGRPLWQARLTWRFPNDVRLARLRWYLESLDGFAGSVQLWDFSAPWPWGLGGVVRELPWINGAVERSWTYGGNGTIKWTYAPPDPTHWARGATVTLSANAAAGATSVSLSGLDVNAPAVVKGQYVQVGRRLYVAAADVTSSGTGTATVTLTGGLLAAATAGDPVRLVEAGCEMRLAEQDFDAQTTAGDGLINVSATFIETAVDF